MRPTIPPGYALFVISRAPRDPYRQPRDRDFNVNAWNMPTWDLIPEQDRPGRRDRERFALLLEVGFSARWHLESSIKVEFAYLAMGCP